MWIWEMLFPVKVTGDQNQNGNIIPRNNDMMTNDDEIVTSWQSCVALKQATKCASTERYIFYLCFEVNLIDIKLQFYVSWCYQGK